MGSYTYILYYALLLWVHFSKGSLEMSSAIKGDRQSSPYRDLLIAAVSSIVLKSVLTLFVIFIVLYYHVVLYYH